MVGSIGAVGGNVLLGIGGAIGGTEAPTPRVIRALGNGMRTYVVNNAFAGGATQRSQTNRFPVRSNSKIYHVKVRQHLFYQAIQGGGSVPTAALPFVDTLFPGPLNFQHGVKPGYENAVSNLTARSLFTWTNAGMPAGQTYFAYPGAAAWTASAPAQPWFVDSDWITLSGEQLLDFWSSVVVPSRVTMTVGGAGYVGSGYLPLNRTLSNAMPRGAVGNLARAAGAQSAADHIAAGYAQSGGVLASPPATLTMTASTSLQGVNGGASGVETGFTPSMLIIETDATAKTAFIGGTSHAEGIGTGSSADVYRGVTYTDPFGDANGCRGMWEMGVFNQGYNYVNMGLPSDWEGRLANTTTNGAVDNAAGYRALFSDLGAAFDHVVWEHAYNDFAKNGTLGTYPAANAVIKKGQTCRNATTGRLLLATTPGTMTVGVPATAITANVGDTYTDGGVVWLDQGAYTVNAYNAFGAYGDAYAGSAFLTGLFGTTPVTRIAMPIPTGIANSVAITSLSASSISVGAIITATVADTSYLANNEYVLITGQTSPTAGYAYGTTGVQITVTGPQTFTYVATTAPAALTASSGTFTVNDMIQSLAQQTASFTPGGTGIGSARDLYRTFITNAKGALVKYVNLIDPSTLVENDHANLDGKNKVEMGVPFKWEYGSHLSGYAAVQCSALITSAMLSQTS